MTRIYREPIVISAGSAESITGAGPAQISGASATESRTVTLARYGLPDGSVDRFVSAEVDIVGEVATVTPAIRVGDRFVFDFVGIDTETTAPDWLVDLTVRDRETGTPTVYHLATRGGWHDDAAISTLTRRYRIGSPALTEDQLTLSLAGDDSAMDRPVSDASMLGLGYGLAFREVAIEEDGCAYAAHSLDFEPSTTFRVDAIFKVYSFDGGAKTLIIKGTGLGNPQFALFIGAGGDIRFRMRDSSGTAITVAKTTPLLTVNTIYHATGAWDGSELRVALDGEFGTAGIPAFTASAAGLTDDLHLGVAPGQPATILDGEIYYAAVYVDGPIDLEAIPAEAFGFAVSDIGLVAEWLLDEGSGMRSDNRIDPDLHPLTLSNPSGPWDPWVYGKTGPVGSAGQLWPVPVGFAQTRGVWGSRSEGLKVKNILHTCLPFVPYGAQTATDPAWWQRLDGLDRVMAGGEALRIQIPAQMWPIRWGSDGVGGWIENYYLPTAPPFAYPAFPTAVPVPGQQIRIGLSPIDGDYTVLSVTRAGKQLYGRRIYLAAPGIGGSGGGVVRIETIGPYDVTATYDGILEFAARPQTPVLVSGWWSAPAGATGPGPFIPDIVEALVVNRAGAAVAPDLATQLAPWAEVAIGADWTAVSVRQAITEAIGVLGVSAAFSTTADGVEVSRLTRPTPSEPTAAVLTDGNTREISVIREVAPVGGMGCSYRHRGDAYDLSDLTALALAGLSDSDMRWLTEESQMVVSGQTPELADRSGVGADLLVTKTIVIDAAQAKRTANYDLALLEPGALIAKVAGSIALAELLPRRSKVVVASYVHPALSNGLAGRVIGIGNDGNSAIVYAWLWKEEP